MKNKILALTAIALIGIIAISFKIKGSDTCLPLVQKEAEVYMKKNKGASITITGGGSGVGISAIMNGTTDVAMSSRKMKMDEKLKLQEAGVAVKEVIISYDALSVIVHPSNSVSNLTREQLEAIFTGKITNWKQVGGSDMKITVYSRETSSGTYEFFKESVLKNKNYAKTVLSLPATGAIVQSISQTKGAIGYVGIAYLDAKVKAINVAYKAKTYIQPTIANAKNKSYPITRPLYLYYASKNEKVAKPFIDFILSAEGQKIVEQEGYVPLR